MKTTVDIEDSLLIAAKKYAAEQRTSLRSLIEAGLRAELAPRRARSTAKTVRWIVVEGGLPEGVDLADRAAMSEWIRAERGAAK